MLTITTLHITTSA